MDLTFGGRSDQSSGQAIKLSFAKASAGEAIKQSSDQAIKRSNIQYFFTAAGGRMNNGVGWSLRRTAFKQSSDQAIKRSSVQALLR